MFPPNRKLDSALDLAYVFLALAAVGAAVVLLLKWL